jgi:hypothetical protein
MSALLDVLRDLKDFSWIFPFLIMAFPPTFKLIGRAITQAWTKAIEDHLTDIRESVRVAEVRHNMHHSENKTLLEEIKADVKRINGSVKRNTDRIDEHIRGHGE